MHGGGIKPSGDGGGGGEEEEELITPDSRLQEGLTWLLSKVSNNNYYAFAIYFNH